MLLVSQFLPKVVKREMPFDVIYRLQYRIALRRLAIVVHLQVIVEYAFRCQPHTFFLFAISHKPRHKITNKD